MATQGCCAISVDSTQPKPILPPEDFLSIHSTLTTFGVTGVGNGMKTELVSASGHNIVVDEPPSLGGDNSGPNPMEYLLAAFSGCVTVMVSIIAKELELEQHGVRWTRLEGGLDLRGLAGEQGAKPYLQTLHGEIQVITPEAQDSEKFRSLQEKVGSRCPVLTMFRHSLHLDLQWIAVSPQSISPEPTSEPDTGA